MSGGTLVTIYGNQLDTGGNVTVSIGGKPCRTDGSTYRYLYQNFFRPVQNSYHIVSGHIMITVYQIRAIFPFLSQMKTQRYKVVA